MEDPETDNTQEGVKVVHVPDNPMVSTSQNSQMLPNITSTVLPPITSFPPENPSKDLLGSIYSQLVSLHEEQAEGLKRIQDQNQEILRLQNECNNLMSTLMEEKRKGNDGQENSSQSLGDDKGDEKYKCTQCGKSFTFQSNLTRHLKEVCCF